MSNLSAGEMPQKMLEFVRQSQVHEPESEAFGLLQAQFEKLYQNMLGFVRHLQLT